jgi:hypothetical protein
MWITKPKPILQNKSLEENIEVQIFSKVDDIPFSDWEKATERENVFLQLPYLSVVECNPPDHFKFRYAIVYQNNQPIAAFYFQIRHFNAKESLKIDFEKTNCVDCVVAGFKKMIAARVDFNTLVLGNLLLTGEQGFIFNSKMEADKRYGIIQKVIASCKNNLKNEKIEVSAVLIKDFYQKQSNFIKNFNEFELEPSMILEIPAAWTCFEDYVSSLNTKARTRYKRAEKKLEPIICRPISSEEVLQYKEEIHNLYQIVSKKAAFNLYNLNIDYLIELEKAPFFKLSLHGYFLADKLVGFSTLIENGDELEAHIIGHDPDVNTEHQLYLNMLYKMVASTIELKKKKLILARTAIEIKSSIGAVAHDMFCYISHQNSIVNQLSPCILNYLYPKKEWTYRHPFK